MSDYIRVLCRSSRPIVLPEITSFIEDGAYFDAPRFEAMPEDAEGDWRTLTIFYHPEKRPLVLHKNVGDALMHAEMAEISAGLPEGLRRRIAATFQVIAIEVGVPTLTEEAWEMLDSLEAYLARTYDGIVFVDGEGFYDAALQKVEEHDEVRTELRVPAPSAASILGTAERNGSALYRRPIAGAEPLD